MLNEWLNQAKENYPQYDIQAIDKACVTAYEIDPKLLEFGLDIANELLPLHPPIESLTTAILYPSFHQHSHLEAKIVERHGEAIWRLLIATQRMSLMDQWSEKRTTEFAEQHHHDDNLRKMLLAMVDDVRIVLIKLAERLAVLKRAKNADEHVRQTLAEQVMTLYAPLANRLGIGQLKWQLEDFAFRYLEPEKYKTISKDLKMRRAERENFIKEVHASLTALMKKNELVNAEVSGRPKHIYSIYKKTHRKNLSVADIYDTSALRILVENISDCYRALSLIHNEWEPIKAEFDDYIAHPKPNGYQSIHTAVIGPQHNNIEIQIRTFKMHEDAELGIAAHWQYKEGGDQQAQIGQKINWLREVLAWQQEITDVKRDLSISNLFADQVYVFTPTGDVLSLTAGATALDFAYHIHTEVGHRCRGAKINGKIVPLTHALQTGDRIEILTGKEAQPSRDWLRADSPYLKTAAARSKVRHWFKKQFFQTHVNAGQIVWDKIQSEYHFPKDAYEKIYTDFNFKTSKDLLAALGAGDISSQSVIQRCRVLFTEKNPLPTTITVSAPQRQKHKNTFVIAGVDDVLTQLARCCTPIPGDEIIGYITQGRGITIHKLSCHNAANAQLKKPERLIDAQWPNSTGNRYPINLQIEATDRPGLLRDISSIVANENASILSANSRVDRVNHIAQINFTIETLGLDQLGKITQKIQQIPGLLTVRRM